MLWWSVQLNLSCVYELRKVDWTWASKMQRPEHLQTEMNGYCQIEKYGMLISGSFQGETERKDYSKASDIEFKEINGIVLDICLLGKYNPQYKKKKS